MWLFKLLGHEKMYYAYSKDLQEAVPSIHAFHMVNMI